MEEFIAKYWIEFAFGILIAVLGFFFKRYLKLEKDNAAHERAEFKAMLLEEVDKRNQAHCVTDQNLKDDIRRLKKGVLSFQGFMFKSHCRELIDSEKEITLKEYEDIEAEHEAYNGLGGNHEGDVLFALVKQKFENHIRSQHEEQ